MTKWTQRSSGTSCWGLWVRFSFPLLRFLLTTQIGVKHQHRVSAAALMLKLILVLFFQIWFDFVMLLCLLFIVISCFNVSVGNIVLPGNLLSVSYFGRSCSVRVEAVRGEDGITLQRPGSLSGLGPDRDESELESSAADLSLQLSLLSVDDALPTASTPVRLANPPLLSSPPTPCTPSYDTHTPPTASEDSSLCSDPTERIPTAPPGGAWSSGTFYCLSCSTKLTFRGKAQKEEAEAGRSKVTYSMIGGLSSQLDVIRETIELPLKHPELFASYGKTRAAFVLDLKLGLVS